MFEFHCQKISEKRDTHTHTPLRGIGMAQCFDLRSGRSLASSPTSSTSSLVSSRHIGIRSIPWAPMVVLLPSGP